LYPLTPDILHLANFIHTGLFRYAFYFLEFSSAADLAVGFSGILGMEIENNFKGPYKALTLSDFWGRWSTTVVDFLQRHLFQKAFFLPSGSGISLFFLPAAACFLQGARFDFFILGMIHGVALVLEKMFLPVCDNNSSFATKTLRFFLTQGFISLSWTVLV
jgi:D-alanyl-lipoteichoic acid acyltransferase DltB (MBOAT superfamily)